MWNFDSIKLGIELEGVHTFISSLGMMWKKQSLGLDRLSKIPGKLRGGI